LVPHGIEQGPALMHLVTLGLLLMLSLFLRAASPVPALDPNVKISTAKTDTNGFLIHRVQSEYQAGETEIRVLMPDKPAAKCRVLYVLPVEATNSVFWGEALGEIKKHDLHNQHGLICVYPTFSHLPWYVDHPTNPQIRQETYFLKVVVPFVEKNYPAGHEQDDRWLLGFSKSGWGAWTLLLRHPEVFGKAAAWDSPLMMEKGLYGMANIAGTQENFENYQVKSLLRKAGANLGQGNRLILLGYGNFREPMQQAHELMDSLKIPHEYRDGPFRKHHWNTGWVSEAVELLARP
jgi:S-formylglutathione hydrolase FrmB